MRQQSLKPTSPRKGAGTTVTRNKNLVPDPTTGPAIFVRSRGQWTTISHNRTLQGRCRQLMHKWRIKDPTRFECDRVQETVDHIVNHCTLSGGISEDHSAFPNAMDQQPENTTVKLCSIHSKEEEGTVAPVALD